MHCEKMNFFSVTWRIENFSMCRQKKGEKLTSPMFTLPELSNTDWNILLYPKGCAEFESNYIYCSMERKDRHTSSNVTTFAILFAVVNTDLKLSVKSYFNSFQINKNEAKGYFELISRDKLYKEAQGFLPNNVLTMQLRICPIFEEQNKTVSNQLEKMFLSNSLGLNFTLEECFSIDCKIGNSTSLTHCSFLTHIPVERRVLIWSINELDEKRKSKEKMSIILESKFHDRVKFLLVCYFESKNKNNKSMKIDISRMGSDLRSIFVKCEVQFLDSLDVIQGTQKSEHVFDDTYHRWSFPLIDKFSSLKGLTRNDSLKMKCEFLISHDPQNIVNLTLGGSSRQNDLTEKMQKMVKEEESIDVSFECESEKKFPAHKLLICAKSPVFQAMFSSDTLERQTGVVRMHDTDTDTVERLRDYLYFGNLPDLKTEEMVKLFAVADKYQIEKLKEECVVFLKNTISVENVYGILMAADMHQDAGLKDYIIDFLTAEMDFGSDEWESFTTENCKLAAESMKKCLVKMKQALL